MGCICFGRGYQIHYQLETQPVNHKQHIGGEELAGVLQGSSLGWQSSWSRRLRLLIFISCLDIMPLVREDFSSSHGSEALVLDNNKHSLKAPFTSCVFTNGFISSPQQMFWEHNLIIFYNSSQDCRPYFFVLSSKYSTLKRMDCVFKMEDKMQGNLKFYIKFEISNEVSYFCDAGNLVEVGCILYEF